MQPEWFQVGFDFRCFLALLPLGEDRALHFYHIAASLFEICLRKESQKCVCQDYPLPPIKIIDLGDQLLITGSDFERYLLKGIEFIPLVHCIFLHLPFHFLDYQIECFIFFQGNSPVFPLLLVITACTVLCI